MVSSNPASAEGKVRDRVLRVGVKSNSKKGMRSSRGEGESPIGRIPMSEADSIFDEHNTLGAGNNIEFVLKRNSNQEDEIIDESIPPP